MCVCVCVYRGVVGWVDVLCCVNCGCFLAVLVKWMSWGRWRVAAAAVIAAGEGWGEGGDSLSCVNRCVLCVLRGGEDASMTRNGFLVVLFCPRQCNRPSRISPIIYPYPPCVAHASTQHTPLVPHAMHACPSIPYRHNTQGVVIAIFPF